jgi:hypothetical protein
MLKQGDMALARGGAPDDRGQQCGAQSAIEFHAALFHETSKQPDHPRE